MILDQSKVYLLFFRGKTFISKMIRFFTWGKYSHVALYYNDIIWEAWYPDGVIKTNIKNLNHSNNTNIDVYKLVDDLDNVKRLRLLKFLDSQCGKKYDLKGILGFVARQESLAEQDKWFCSELICYGFNNVLKYKVLNVECNKVSPTLLSYSPKFMYVKSIVYKNNKFEDINA